MTEPTFRQATPADALALAELMDQAGQGIPAWLWAQDAAEGQSALDVGMARARRSEGAFSYPNATVLEYAGQVAGMLLAYAQPAEMNVDEELDGVPEFLVSLVELECLVPGSFYINAIAVYPQYRSMGLGALLMAESERLAVAHASQTLSLIVFDDNQGAVRFYRYLGFEVAAHRPLVGHESHSHTGRALLMTRTLG